MLFKGEGLCSETSGRGDYQAKAEKEKDHQPEPARQLLHIGACCHVPWKERDVTFQGAEIPIPQLT